MNHFLRRLVLLLAVACVPLAVSADATVIPGPVVSVGGGKLYKQGSTTQQVKDNKGILVGVFVAQSSSCTIKLWDNTAGSGTVLVDTFSAAAATWYPLPLVFNTGLFVTVGGTCSYTFSYT